MWLHFDKNDLYLFMDYLSNIYFAQHIAKFDYVLKRQTLQKMYMFDNWFMNAISFSFTNTVNCLKMQCL